MALECDLTLSSDLNYRPFSSVQFSSVLLRTRLSRSEKTRLNGRHTEPEVASDFLGFDSRDPQWLQNGGEAFHTHSQIADGTGAGSRLGGFS